MMVGSSMITRLLLLAASLWKTAVAQPLPAIFGQTGAASPVPANVAQYILDLEAQGIYLHYFGDEQLFSLALSPKLRERLQTVAGGADMANMPAAYGVDHIANRVCNWNDAPGWATPQNGADARTVFYGRELRQAPGTAYGNAIHLSLGPEEDPEGWTPEEMSENFAFWQAMHQQGMSVAAADELRQFRHDVSSKLGGTFMQRWGTQISTKAHRFALQMYTADSQNPAGLFFEKFLGGRPPTTQVIFFEAEDGCKGTPTPVSAVASRLFEVTDEPAQGVVFASVRPFQPIVLSAALFLSAVLLVCKVLRASRSVPPSLSSDLQESCYEDVE